MTTHTKTTFLDWVLRILFSFIALLAVGLLMLNLVSGTGQPQREGLEKAFSQSLGTPMTIGALNQFNVFPQFIIDASDLKSSQDTTAKSIKANHISLGFSLLDLLQNKKTIQFFDIRGGEFFLPSFSAKKFTNITTHITPPTIQNANAKFLAEATVDGDLIKLQIPMTHTKSGINFNYSIPNSAELSIHYKLCEMTGTIKPNNEFNWNKPSEINKDCDAFLNLFKP